MDNPTHLERGLEDDKPKPTEEQTEAARVIAEVEANQKKGDHGLNMFALCPQGMKDIELFNHQINCCQRMYVLKEKDHKISDWLEVFPRTPHQRSLMDLDYHWKMQGNLLEDLDQGVHLQKAAQVCLNNLGLIKSSSMFINNPTRLARLRARLELQRSLGRRQDIEALDDVEDTTKEISRPAISFLKRGCCTRTATRRSGCSRRNSLQQSCY